MTVATIQKWGNSQGLCIPKHILIAAGLNIDEKVVVDVSDGNIVIKKADKKRKTIRELFEAYGEEYAEKEIDWGKPVGDEIW